VIPVIDLRAKFGMPATDPTSQTVIIVVQIAAAAGNLTMGVLVDEVLEVRAIADTDIEAPPALPQDIDTSFILGVGKLDKHIVFLLDIDRVLTVDERSEVIASATVSGAQVEG
jgi:purine-binding chemotaxis protein CheW